MSLLEVRELRKEFFLGRAPFSKTDRTVIALDGVSFKIHQGENFGIVGESGCGKTTLARCILKLHDPSSGEILFSGQNISKVPGKSVRKIRRKIQMIFQDPYSSLNPRMTAFEIIEEPLVIYRVGTKQSRRDQAIELLHDVGLEQRYGSSYPHQLSGGQRQRIGIARALALEPELIVADEPLSALDAPTQSQILSLLRELQVKFGLTFLFIAHDLSLAKNLCDRVAIMYSGKIVELAPTPVLFQQPFHPYTKLLLQSAPVLDMVSSGKPQDVPQEGLSSFRTPAGCRFHPRCSMVLEKCKFEEPRSREYVKDRQVACHALE